MDLERTEYLNQMGYVVLRFTNESVLNDIDTVLEEISDTSLWEGLGVGFELALASMSIS